MSGDITATRYVQIRLISQVLQAATYAGVVNASDAAREFAALQRELESPSKRHWADTIIAIENAQHAEIAS